MELKLYQQHDADMTIDSSNRTFMELKSIHLGNSKIRINVLIVPLWN